MPQTTVPAHPLLTPSALAAATPTPPATLTVREVAHELRLSRARAWQLVAGGAIPSVHIGRLRRIRRVDLDAYLAHLADEEAAS